MNQERFSAASKISPDVRRRFSTETDSAPQVSPQPAKSQCLLWVDDSRILLALYKSVFESLGFEVLATSSPEQALHPARLAAADVVILDYDMPEIDGAKLACLIKARHPMLPVVLYSGSPCLPETANEWVDAICSKAAPREELLTTIERLSRTVCQSPASPTNLRPRLFRS